MNNLKNLACYFSIFCCLYLIGPLYVFADVDLPWSTTFDCNEWTQSDGLLESDINCDGLSAGGGWTCSGNEGQITSTANNPDGRGGRGQRHWEGDGINANSGGLQLTFKSPQSELWVRWYMRYNAGFSWSSLTYDKWLYFNNGETGAVVPEFAGSELNVWINGGTPAQIKTTGGQGWSKIMGGSVGDGLWHHYEMHLKLDTNGTDGVLELWVDGTRYLFNDKINFARSTGWTTFKIGSNQRSPNNGGCTAVDFDDIAVSNTGYIGPIAGGGGGTDAISPSVSISLPASGQTISGNATLSANASDNIGVTGVQFKLNGTNIGSEVTNSPYSYTLDTTAYSDGSHTLTATARDAAGNMTTSSPLSVTISNGGGVSSALFNETFEDAAFAARGWYDNTNLQLSTAEHVAGSTSSVEFHFLQGATTPTSGPSTRHKFNDTDEVYVSYYVKYSANWEGSNKAYHPHELYIMSNLDGDWSGLAYTHLTAYIEQNEGEPLIAIQDGQNIDESRIGVDLTNITEQRSVAGCNGDSDGYGNGQCYLSGSVHWNGKDWRAGSVYFQDAPGTYYKNDWHFVETYLKLNSISGGQGMADGIVKYWYDGNLIISHSDVVLRTGQYPGMKFNKLVIAPYIGDGSPVDQTFWIDNLTVATSRPTSDSKPSAPTNLRIQ